MIITFILASSVVCKAFLVMPMAKSTNRSSTQIIGEILGLCRQPKTKTQIMYRTNLSWAMSNRYLSFLQSRRLLEIHHSIIKYATTQKGMQFVEKWEELTELLSQNKPQSKCNHLPWTRIPSTRLMHTHHQNWSSDFRVLSVVVHRNSVKKTNDA